MTPVVARVAPEFVPTPAPTEVESVFECPLETFLRDEHHSFEDSTLGGSPYRLHYFDVHHGGKSYTVWGLTAHLLIQASVTMLESMLEYR